MALYAESWSIVLGLVAVVLALPLIRNWVLARRDDRDEPWARAVRQILDDDRSFPHKTVRTVNGKTHTSPAYELPVQIMPHLLLGDRACATKVGLLVERGVTAILSVGPRATDGVQRSYAEAGITYKHIPAEDEEGYPLVRLHQHAASSFIRAVLREGGRCLIHCVAGINRSGTLAAAELMLHERLPVLEAVQRCKEARRVILSNHSFQCQLVALARQQGLLGDCPMCTTARGSLVNRPVHKPAGNALKALVS